MLPSTEVLLDTATAPSVMGLIDMLEDLDDVQNVYTNADIPRTFSLLCKILRRPFYPLAMTFASQSVKLELGLCWFRATVILGIDPGSRKTGFGIIRIDRKQPVYVSGGTIRLPVKEPLSVRLRVLFESLSEIIDTHRPTVAAIESVFMAAQILRSSWVIPVVPRWLLASSTSSRFSNMRRARLNNQSWERALRASSRCSMVTVLLGLSAEPLRMPDGLAAALPLPCGGALRGVGGQWLQAGRLR